MKNKKTERTKNKSYKPHEYKVFNPKICENLVNLHHKMTPYIKA
jgi:hypothetical protein